MTFVGKVLVVVQLVLAICFMAFAGAVYTAETNWREKSKQLQADVEKARGDANTAVQQQQQRETEMTAQLQALEQRVALVDGQLKTASDQLNRTTQELQDARTAVDRQTAVANLSQEQATFRQEETQRQRERNQRLQEQINELLAKVRENEDALFARDLTIEAMQERQEEVIAQMATYRQILLANNMSLKPEDYENLVAKMDPPPPVTGQVIRTEVSKTSGVEFVLISLGKDDGFEKGHELSVFRGNNYLGKIKLTSVYPDRAVGTVIPSSRPRNGQIQKGDNVSPKL
jgi:archaellum component FlaC